MLVAPRHPFRCRALPVGTWCAAGRPESPRAGQSEVTSPPCAVWWVSPCAADPWKPPRHLQCLQYTLSSLTGRESSTRGTFFALSVQIPRSGPFNNRCAPSTRSFRPLRAARGRWSAPARLADGLDPSRGPPLPGRVMHADAPGSIGHGPAPPEPAGGAGRRRGAGCSPGRCVRVGPALASPAARRTPATAPASAHGPELDMAPRSGPQPAGGRLAARFPAREPRQAAVTRPIRPSSGLDAHLPAAHCAPRHADRRRISLEWRSGGRPGLNAVSIGPLSAAQRPAAALMRPVMASRAACRASGRPAGSTVSPSPAPPDPPRDPRPAPPGPPAQFPPPAAAGGSLCRARARW